VKWNGEDEPGGRFSHGGGGKPRKTFERANLMAENGEYFSALGEMRDLYGNMVEGTLAAPSVVPLASAARNAAFK